MSEREIAKKLIDQMPERRMYYVISYLQRRMSFLYVIKNDNKKRKPPRNHLVSRGLTGAAIQI